MPHELLSSELSWYLNGDCSEQTRFPSRHRCIFELLNICVIICFKVCPPLCKLLKGKEKSLSCLLLNSLGTGQCLAGNRCLGLKNYTYLLPFYPEVSSFMRSRSHLLLLWVWFFKNSNFIMYDFAVLIFFKSRIVVNSLGLSIWQTWA